MARTVPTPQTPAASRGYGDDLAFVHDAGFGKFAADSAPWLIEYLRSHGIASGRVIDLGCGSGIWAAALLAAGYDVLGYDLSAAMLTLARARAPRAVFRQASFLAAELPPCVAVTALGEIFNYLFDAANSPRQLPRLFERIHAALPRGGRLIFDLATPGRVPEGQRRNYSEADDWACLHEAVEDRGGQTLTRTITTFRRVGRAWRRDQELHRLRLYTPSEIKQRLRDAGFRVQTVRAYGAMQFPPGWIGFLARKP